MCGNLGIGFFGHIGYYSNPVVIRMSLDDFYPRKQQRHKYIGKRKA